MYSIHNKLDDFKNWVDVDIRDDEIRNKVTNMINEDYQKDSPKILEDIKGKYSPYKKHLSVLGKTHADLINPEHELAKTFFVSLAAAKFKKGLKKNLNKTIR